MNNRKPPKPNMDEPWRKTLDQFSKSQQKLLERITENQQEVDKKDGEEWVKAAAYRDKLKSEGADTLAELIPIAQYVQQQMQICYEQGYARTIEIWKSCMIAVENAAGLYLAFPDPGVPVTFEQISFCAGLGGMARITAVHTLTYLAEQNNIDAMLRLAEISLDQNERVSYLKRAVELGSKQAELKLKGDL